MSVRRNVRVYCTNTHLQQIVETDAPRVHHLIKRRQHRPFLPSCPVSPCRVISHLNIQLLLLLQRTFVYLHLNRNGKKRIRQRKTKQQKHRQEQKKLTQQEVRVIKNHNSSQSHRAEKTPFSIENNKHVSNKEQPTVSEVYYCSSAFVLRIMFYIPRM